MLNKAMIIGRLGRDPELRYTQSGVPVTTLNVATGETYIDRDGNKNEVTEWHRVSVFQRQAENCVKYLRKGSLVYVEGSLQTRKWQDQQGQERSTTVIRAMRVTFLERRSDLMRENYGDAAFSGTGDGEPSYQGNKNDFDPAAYSQNQQNSYSYDSNHMDPDGTQKSMSSPSEDVYPSESSANDQSGMNSSNQNMNN